MFLYLISALLVLLLSGLLAMAGLGAAFLFVPLFFYLGVPLPQATATALLLNTVSLSFASAVYYRQGLINLRMALPVLLTAVILAPVGAWMTPLIDKNVLLALFAAFLIFAGAMMLFYRPRPRADSDEADQARKARRVREVTMGAGVGSIAGFLGGLLGVGGGNFIVPVFNWLGLDAKVAAGTTALVVVFSSLSGFLGHAALGGIDPVFVLLTGTMAAIGSFVGAQLMSRKLSSGQLKLVIGVLLWVIAAKIIFDLL
jgi:uncharacterized membrane protein YfcA